MSTPGIFLRGDIAFQSYSKPRLHDSRRGSHRGNSLSAAELLLQSSSHPKIDYTAREADLEGNGSLKHYVGVYDPHTGDLKVIEARKMTIRRHIRQASPTAEEAAKAEAEDKKLDISNYSLKNKLTQEFGGKKAKKSVLAAIENALVVKGDPDRDPNALESALVSSLPTTSALTLAERSEIAQENKPIPSPNHAATAPQDVYAISALINPTILSTLPTQDWVDLIVADEPVSCTSRYVAKRVVPITKMCQHSGSNTYLQILRYIYLLLEMQRVIKFRARGIERFEFLPRGDRLAKELSGDIKPQHIDAIRRKFVEPDSDIITTFGKVLLHETICALTLHIPPTEGNSPGELATEIMDLRDDLTVDSAKIRQYYLELGCKVDKPKENEQKKWGVKKANKETFQRMRIARLRIPPEFPKQRSGATGARRN